MIIPTEKFLIVESKPVETTTKSGIILPENNNKSTSGKVVVCGGHDETGYIEGDTVYFKEWSSIEQEIDGKKYLIVKKEDIIAYVKAN